MSTAYQTQNYSQKQPAGTGHGFFKNSTHLHAISGAISTWAAGDTIAVGWLPPQATVKSVTLKAAAQIDSNGAPTLALDVGVAGTPQLFKSAVTDVGHTAGATVDTTINPGGMLWQNTTGSDVAVLITVHTAAATPVAGTTLELDVEYYVEDVGGSNP
jgi:hypothetical protein